MTARFHADFDAPPPVDFGAWLRRERERAGRSLDDIANETKVGKSMLIALERNDLSHWPGGIFRRAFVRSYAEIIGLNPDSTVAAFVDAYPEERTRGAAGSPSRKKIAPLRLTLASDGYWWDILQTRLGAALTDLMAPIVVALPSGLLGGQTLFWIVLSVVAVLYVSVGTLLLNTTPGLWMMHRVGQQRRVRRAPADQSLWTQVESTLALHDVAAEPEGENELSPDHIGDTSPAHR